MQVPYVWLEAGSGSVVTTRLLSRSGQMGVKRAGSDSDSPGLPPTAFHTACRSMGYCCLLERCQQWLGLNTLPGVGMPQQDEQCAWLQQGTATHSCWHPHYYSSPMVTTKTVLESLTS